MRDLQYRGLVKRNDIVLGCGNLQWGFPRVRIGIIS